MADTLKGLVRTYASLEALDVGASEIPSKVAEGIAAKEYKLVDVVKELGDALLSEDDSVRVRGVTLLSAVVGTTDRATLDRQSTQTLTSFFTEKLSDTPSLTPSVIALTNLTESPSFGTGEGILVIRGIFASISLSIFPQATRFHVFTLIDRLMTRSRPALKRLGKEFIGGYCALVEGEKDPRNLMLSFSIIRVILVEFEISDNVEDLFDITFCYFPITFTPPPDDPYGITSDDLVEALRNCLSATPKFGHLALPLFLDKMQAASEKAKRQTLQALTACFPIYGAAVSGEWAGRFSEALSIEVFHATDEATSALALTTFQSLYSTLYPDAAPTIKGVIGGETEDVEMSESSAGVEGVAVKVVSNCLEELKEPEKSNAQAAVKILSALMNCSAPLTRYIISMTFPQLIRLYKDPDDMSIRPPILSCFSALLASLSESKSPLNSTVPKYNTDLIQEAACVSLELFRDDLLSVVTSGTRLTSSRVEGLQAIVNLVKVSGFLSQAEVEYCVNTINEILMQASEEEAYEASLDCLVAIAALFPQSVEQHTLPLLFTKLPSEAPSTSEDIQSYKRSLSSLASICIYADMFETLSVRILSRLENVCVCCSRDPTIRKQQTIYAHHLLATLYAVLKAKVDLNHTDIPKYISKFLPRLLAIFILPTTRSDQSDAIATDERLVMDAGKVLGITMQRARVDQQAEFHRATNLAFSAGSLSLLLPDRAKDAGDIPFNPTHDDASVAQSNIPALCAQGVLASHPDVIGRVGDMASFLKQSLHRVVKTKTELQTGWGVQMIGSIVNKRANDVGEFLNVDVFRFCNHYVFNVFQPIQTRIIALRVWAWITKGLIVRSDDRGYDMTSRILEVLHEPNLSQAAASALATIADESDRVLSKENHAVIRLFYKQKFFNYLLPKLVAAHKSASPENEVVYLIALSNLLLHIPRTLAISELPKLLPLLFTSLDLGDSNLRSNVISTLTVLAREVPAEMENVVNNIVTKILKGLHGDPSSTSEQKPSIKLRLASLQFLAIIPAHFTYSVLHPQKALVLKELGKAVDDPRREVRKAAVDCRTQWFSYSG